MENPEQSSLDCVFFYLIGYHLKREGGSLETGRLRSRGWKNFGRRLTSGVGGIENWTIFMDVHMCIIPKVKQRLFTSSQKEENKFDLISERVNIQQRSLFFLRNFTTKSFQAIKIYNETLVKLFFALFVAISYIQCGSFLVNYSANFLLETFTCGN